MFEGMATTEDKPCHPIGRRMQRQFCQPAGRLEGVVVFSQYGVRAAAVRNPVLSTPLEEVASIAMGWCVCRR